MLKKNPATGQPGDCLIVGRGSVGIYLALKNINTVKHKVLLPANICYAAIYPVLNAGYIPLFCDVEKYSGNVTLRILQSIDFEDVFVAVLPHMYGNPIDNLPEIYEFLSSKDVLLIEDCASLMTNDGDSYIPGTIGDYIVYSTGHSKTIDIGIGGFLFSSKHSLIECEKIENTLPAYTQEIGSEFDVFSKIYRTIRNAGENHKIVKIFYESLQASFAKIFLFSLDEKQKEKIVQACNKLNEVINTRRYEYSLYTSLLNDECSYKFNDKAVPWRYNMLIAKNREGFIKYCLDNSLPVSDWYPLVTPMFNEDGEYPGARWHAEHIVNFPLLIEHEEIKRICGIINSYNFG